MQEIKAAMSSRQIVKLSKPMENCLLAAIGLIAHAPLYYQLPRCANGLDPTFVHPQWIAVSKFPIVLYMAEVPPFVWIALMILCFIRLCRNYGWKLETMKTRL